MQGTAAATARASAFVVHGVCSLRLLFPVRYGFIPAVKRFSWAAEPRIQPCGDISFLLRCATIINVNAIGKADNRPAENDNPVGVWWFKEVKIGTDRDKSIL